MSAFGNISKFLKIDEATIITVKAICIKAPPARFFQRKDQFVVFHIYEFYKTPYDFYFYRLGPRSSHCLRFSSFGEYRFDNYFKPIGDKCVP